VGVVAFLVIVGVASAQSANPLSAEESDPAALGWMTGFPPPAEKLIMQPESNFFSFPKLRWTVCHIRECALGSDQTKSLKNSNKWIK